MEPRVACIRNLKPNHRARALPLFQVQRMNAEEKTIRILCRLFLHKFIQFRTGIFIIYFELPKIGNLSLCDNRYVTIGMGLFRVRSHITLSNWRYLKIVMFDNERQRGS